MIKNPHKVNMSNDFFTLVGKTELAKLTDNIEARKMLTILSNDMNDEEVLNVFSWKVNQALMIDKCDEDAFKDCYPIRQEEIGSISDYVWQIGDSLRNGIIAGISKNVLTQGGVLVIGPTGTYKTTLLKNFITKIYREDVIVVIFQRKKNELDDVTGEKIRKWTPDKIKLSVFQMRDPANKLANLIARGKLYASKRFAMEGIEMYLSKYKEQIQKTGVYPGLQGLYNFIKEDPVFSKKHPLSRSGQYREAVLYVLSEIIQGSRGIYNCGWSNFLDELLEEKGTVNIIDVSSLEEIAIEFLYGHIIGSTYTERMNSEKEKPTKIFASDDSFEQYHKRQDEKTETGLGNTSHNFLMGRWQNIGQIGLIQDASCLPEMVVNNAKVVILTGLWGGDFRIYQRIMGLTNEMIEQIRSYPPGVAVVKLNGIWPYAFPIRLRPYVSKGIDSYNHTDELLKWKPALEETKIEVEDKELSNNAWQLLIDASIYPLDGVVERFKRQKLSNEEGEKAIKELINKNLIKTWLVPAKHGRKLLMEVLDEGWLLLKKIGKEKPKDITKGGFLHNNSVEELVEWAKPKGYQYWTNFCRGDKEIDLVLQDSNGRLIAFEVQMATNHLKENIEKDIRQAGVDFVVICCRDARLKSEIAKEVASLDGFLNQRVAVYILNEINKMDITQLLNKVVR